MLTFIEILLVVSLILLALKTPPGRWASKFLPTPFWIYFIPIVCGTLGLLPSSSPAYTSIGFHVLPAALVLLLIGTPIGSLFKMGIKASQAILIGMSGMILGTLISFFIMSPFLPGEAWKAAGALLATWTGGSANLISVKEVLSLSDEALAPLIIVDTLLSYSWLALLIFGAGYQKWYDSKLKKGILSIKDNDKQVGENFTFSFNPILLCLVAGFVVGEIAILLGKGSHIQFPVLSIKAWAILWATTSAVGLAMTPLNRLEKRGASTIGTFLLYLVLATIGAKTNLNAALEAPVFIIYGIMVLLIHGGILFSLGRLFNIPLFLLATASQANVGGPVSAPIVAGVYRPGTSHMGVLMALAASILGTYIGSMGGWLCHVIAQWR